MAKKPRAPVNPLEAAAKKKALKEAAITAVGRQGVERIINLAREHGILDKFNEKMLPILQEHLGQYTDGGVETFVGSLEVLFVWAGQLFGWPTPLAPILAEGADELGDEIKALASKDEISPEDQKKAVEASGRRIQARFAKKMKMPGAWLLIKPEEQHRITAKWNDFCQDPARAERLTFWREQLGWSPRLLRELDTSPITLWETLLSERLGSYKAKGSLGNSIKSFLKSIVGFFQDEEAKKLKDDIREHVHGFTERMDGNAPQQLKRGDELEALLNKR